MFCANQRLLRQVYKALRASALKERRQLVEQALAEQPLDQESVHEAMAAESQISDDESFSDDEMVSDCATHSQTTIDKFCRCLTKKKMRYRKHTLPRSERAKMDFLTRRCDVH